MVCLSEEMTLTTQRNPTTVSNIKVTNNTSTVDRHLIRTPPMALPLPLLHWLS